MHVVAVTERLVVREWCDDDVAPLATMGLDTEVVRYLGGSPWSINDAAEQISLFRSIQESLGVTTWAAEDRTTGALLGYCGFARTNATWLRPGIIEIGWLLDRHRWGEGLATEAANAVLPLGLARVEPWRIVSKCHVENVASEGVMRRLGLKRAGVVRRPQDFTVMYRLPP